MGHFGTDAVHIRPYKMGKALKESAEKFGIGLFQSSL